ncbi:MAG: hypothetical protein IPM77_18170 [Crocinitomicaceae bacterium]|nr:hypothetical protein [Crocinitomicaceae bacterium]
MCGIFAAISVERPFEQKRRIDFDAALNSMAHRGPDAGKSEIFSFKSSSDQFQFIFRAQTFVNY